MNRILAGVLSSAALAALSLAIVSACSSGGSNTTTTGGGYTLTNCPNSPILNGSSASAACLQCVESSCSSQLANVNTACAAAFACACPAGVDASSCPSQSLPDGGPTPCAAAIGVTNVVTLPDGGFGLNTSGFFGCAVSTCTVQCATGGDGG